MGIIVRKNVETMPSDEWDRFVASLYILKHEIPNGSSISKYDQITQHHAQAMSTLTLFPGETGTSRNVAHRGPAFGPWHRQALRELEQLLLEIQASEFPFSTPVGIPYWRWNVLGDTWFNSSFWNRVGGDGDPNDGWKVKTGPFAGWSCRIVNGSSFATRTGGILRRFVRTKKMPGWGDTSSVVYDRAPWNEDPSSDGFRRYIEMRHNSVHINVGGDMTTPTSPNDPIFWLHHCNCDRAWARWQTAKGIQTYQPNGEGPSGHNKLDVPIFLDSAAANKANGDMLDWRNIDYLGTGFTYDTLNA